MARRVSREKQGGVAGAAEGSVEGGKTDHWGELRDSHGEPDSIVRIGARSQQVIEDAVVFHPDGLGRDRLAVFHPQIHIRTLHEDPVDKRLVLFFDVVLKRRLAVLVQAVDFILDLRKRFVDLRLVSLLNGFVKSIAPADSEDEQAQR